MPIPSLPQAKNLHKVASGHVLECKEATRNEVKIGIIEGYIATWDIDRGNGFIQDKFLKGAFAESIRDLKQRNRQLRCLWTHDSHSVLGGFPAESLREDEKGLFGRAEINLDNELGRWIYSLAKQGVIVDFSVGFQIVEATRDEGNDLRII